MNMDLPISRCAVMRPATETSVVSLNSPRLYFSRAASQDSVGVNLLRNGKIFFTSSALSLARRWSINEFVSSIRVDGVNHEMSPSARRNLSALVKSRLDEGLKIFSVTSFFHLVERNKFQRRRIDAIAQAALVARAIIKNVSKMRIGSFRTDFRAHHAEGSIRVLNNFFVFDRFGKTWPAAAGIEFVQRAEQRFTAYDVHVNAVLVIVPKFVAKRRFGGGILRDIELHRR